MWRPFRRRIARVNRAPDINMAGRDADPDGHGMARTAPMAPIAPLRARLSATLARFRCTAHLVTGLALAGLVVAGLVVICLAAGLVPAAAQFGGIFGDPPRPPGNVPSRPPAPPPDDRFPDQRRQYPPQYQYPPPAPQQYPEPPPPAPGNAGIDPPGAAPGGIQSQSLPPPPGGVPVDATATPAVAPANLPPGQRPARDAPQQQANTGPQPGDEVVIAPPTQKIVNPTAVFSGLDKITGRITSFDVSINETVQFGALQVTPRACYTRPPTETQNTDAFVAVDEVTLQGEVKRIFTGWMFAASPGLHGVEHPIYDVWLTDCKGGSPPVAQAQAPAPAPAPAPARPRSPQRPPPPRYAPPR